MARTAGAASEARRRAGWEWASAAVDGFSYRLLNTPLAAPVALVATLVLALGYFTMRSHFFYDDYIHFGTAQREGLSLGYLAQDVMGHFAPAHRLFDWLIQALFPGEFWVAQVILLACFAGSALLLYLLLEELFGTGLGALILTLLYGTSLVHVDVSMWWSAALHSLPAALLSLLSMLAYLRFHRTGSRRLLALSVAAFLVGLLFYIKPLLVPLYLVLLRVLLLDPERPTRESLSQLAREWRIWALYLVPAGLYLAVFLTQYLKFSSFPAGWVIRQYFEIAWFQVFTPSFLGVFISNNSPDANAVAAVQFVVAALVVTSLVLNQRAWRGWVFFGLVFLVNGLMVGGSRIGDFFGPGIAYQYRYYVEVTYLFPIALGAAFLPLQSQQAESRRELSPSWPAHLSGVLVVAVAIHLLLAWSGAHRVMEKSPGPKARTYMENVKASLTRINHAGRPTFVVDDVLPEYVMGPWFLWGAPYAYNRYSWVFPLIDPELVFDRPAQPLFRVNDDGTLQPVTFEPHAGGEPGDLLAAGVLRVKDGLIEHQQRDVCIRSEVNSSLIELNLDPPLNGERWYLELHYNSRTRQTLPLFVDGGGGYPWLDREVTLEAGTGAVLAELGGPQVERVRFDLPPHQYACLDQLHVGRLIPRG